MPLTFWLHYHKLCITDTNESQHHLASHYIYEPYLLKKKDEVSTNLHALYRPSTERITQNVFIIVIIHEAWRTMLYAQPKWDTVEKQEWKWINGSIHHCKPETNLYWVYICIWPLAKRNVIRQINTINTTSNYYIFNLAKGVDLKGSPSGQ